MRLPTTLAQCSYMPEQQLGLQYIPMQATVDKNAIPKETKFIKIQMILMILAIDPLTCLVDKIMELME